MQVDHCTFMNNIGIRPDLDANTSVFNFRSQSSGGLGLLYSQISNAKASVHNCTFINNSAGVHPSNANDPRPQVYAPFGHGGGMVVRFSNYANDTAIKISDCLFRDNQAHYSGGAIYAVMIRHPRNNSMVIHNSSFVNCSAINTGGGLSVQVKAYYFTKHKYIALSLYENTLPSIIQPIVPRPLHLPALSI